MKKNDSEQLHRLMAEAFPALEKVIGWEAGYDPLRTTPAFAAKQEDISRLVWNPFCAQNLTGYLVKSPAVQAEDKAKKIGICVKGCDSRSLVALIQEKFVGREQLFVFGFPCRGIVDWRRVLRQMPFQAIASAAVENDDLVVKDARGVFRLPLEQVLARKCRRCIHPNPVIYDVLVDAAVAPRVSREGAYQDVAAVEGLPLQERLAFWRGELDKCLRCYACRNACPLCVCQDRCIAETRDPKWLTQYLDLPEKFLFHFIHALHLAGRCTECGECERVCPMEIPVALMKEKLNQIVSELLGYAAGLDPQAVPPLLTFDPADTGI